MGTNSAGAWTGLPLYTLDFEQQPFLRSVYVDKLYFQGTPMPPTYAGKSLPELNGLSMAVTNALTLTNNSAYTNLDASPELRRHPLLDQLVADMKKDPLALASYVINEIDLTDPYAVAESNQVVKASISVGAGSDAASSALRQGEEFFAKGQKGSSAMPHKRNPIISERICGMARVVRANSLVGLENVALWHERDISHSSAERVVLPDSSIALDYILQKAASLIEGLVVFPERMLENLQLTKGLVFSGQILLALTQKGVARETAYEWVQRNAMRVWETGENFKELLKGDAEINAHLSGAEIDGVFKLGTYLRNVDRIFDRVFGESTNPGSPAEAAVGRASEG